MLFAFILLQALVSVPQNDGFSFFQPSVTVSQQERTALKSGRPVARTLPAGGREDAVFSAVRVDIDGDRLVAWTREVEQFKKSPYVLAIGRFSSPPRIEDLAKVSLDAEDLKSIRTCHPGSCGLKLSASEMKRLRESAEGSGGDDAVQQEFRQILLERVQLYLRTGEIPPYQDRHASVSPASHFVTLLDHTGSLTSHVPQISEYLRNYPSRPDEQIESFVYWSKEQSEGKAIISMTHVNIIRNHEGNLPDTLIVSRDIFSTHYVDASLSITALISGDSGHSNYLVYLNRTEVDILHGPSSGFVRHEMQLRIRSSAAGMLQEYRQRLESGDPPAPISTEQFRGHLRSSSDAIRGTAEP